MEVRVEGTNWQGTVRVDITERYNYENFGKIMNMSWQGYKLTSYFCIALNFFKLLGMTMMTGLSLPLLPVGLYTCTCSTIMDSRCDFMKIVVIVMNDGGRVWNSFLVLNPDLSL